MSKLYHRPRGYPLPLAVEWPDHIQVRVVTRWSWVWPWQMFAWSQRKYLSALRQWCFWCGTGSIGHCGVEAKNESIRLLGVGYGRGVWITGPKELAEVEGSDRVER